MEHRYDDSELENDTTFFVTALLLLQLRMQKKIRIIFESTAKNGANFNSNA